MRLRFWTAIREKCLDKFVDTFLEEPANQRDEAEDAENEYHQIRSWRGHFRRYERGISGGKGNVFTAKAGSSSKNSSIDGPRIYFFTSTEPARPATWPPLNHLVVSFLGSAWDMGHNR